jgi:hypothetical protein
LPPMVERLELLPGIISKTQVRSEMSRSEKKSMALITMLERGVPPKVRCLYYLMEVHIYRGQPT